MQRNFETLNETQFVHTLENGLRIYYQQKKDFSKTFAVLATDFGSIDESFTLDGVRYDTPTGIAHFLEHKMFEDEDGNALQKFGATGASPNAFTSHTMTAYHFSCTSDFEKNLEILLKFVFTPYFTEENVEKEKGIIGQEIGMMDDMPTWQAMVGMFEGLYKEHPVRRSIAGSVSSIADIDAALLYKCHKAFYSPSNMTLVIVGDIDFAKACSMADEFSPKESTIIGERHYGNRNNKVYEAVKTQKMAVSMPIFMLGIKDIPLQLGESKLERTIIGDIASSILAGKSSALYSDLYSDGLINSSFDAEYSLFKQAACAIIAGESRDPKAVKDKIVAEINRISQDLDEALFIRMKNARYGMMMRTLDDFGDFARMEIDSIFANEEFLNFPSVFEDITIDKVKDMLVRWSQDDVVTLSIVEPN